MLVFGVFGIYTHGLQGTAFLVYLIFVMMLNRRVTFGETRLLLREFRLSFLLGKWKKIGLLVDTQQLMFEAIITLDFSRPEPKLTFQERPTSQLFDSPNTSLFELVISPLRASDEGVYKCDITYLEVKDECAVVQFVNLTTRVKEPRQFPA
ncbi:unnamed protein product [Notodromas monacha]|uniref:Uncharacterized protein n=1 Tax=Notodromas monacha TaxID=399045 RepID=A0A7R9BI53_9CRUS|nr:unnamed protein product [Notodromas monacha]CAG0915649.1 unnamed protein product [Notodromas monacha]